MSYKGGTRLRPVTKSDVCRELYQVRSILHNTDSCFEDAGSIKRVE